jgi:hypothetical protein
MLAGVALGDDQHVAGYGFRLFGAEMFAPRPDPRAEPYLFGAAASRRSGDIFYPIMVHWSG